MIEKTRPEDARGVIVAEILAERHRQDAKWAGPTRHPGVVWVVILAKLMGKLGQLALDVIAEPSRTGQVRKMNLFRRELIQLAAVAVAAAEQIDVEGRLT